MFLIKNMPCIDRKKNVCMVLNTNMALHFLKYEKVVKKKSDNCGNKMQKDYSSHNPFNGHTASS